MTHETEQALIRKVDDIHAVLVGPLEQEEEGLLYRVRNHDRRISSLEHWRWYLIGGGVLLAFLVEVAVAMRR